MKPSLYIINGPLGAGKTTLLKYLLSTPVFADARVVENEFASQSVDSELLAAHRAEVKTIAGVCICCSTGNELTTALEELAESSSQPVIIEATGVANSLVLVEKLTAGQLLDYYDLQHVIFVLDAAEVSRRPELLDLNREELAAADTVLLSKTDLLDPMEVFDMMNQLSSRREGRIESMLHGEIDPAIIQQPSHIINYYLNHQDSAREHEREPSFTIIATSTEDIEPAALEQAWTRLASSYGAERMKGAITCDGAIWHVEATPSQCRITESDNPNETLNLVILGADVQHITLGDITG